MGCADFAQRLGLPPIPSWVMNLANACAKAVDIVGEERMVALGDKSFAAVDKVVEAIELGTTERTGTPDAGFKIGDLTRGLIAVGRERRRGPTGFCLSDCFLGIR